jgi:hypothetical protein
VLALGGERARDYLVGRIVAAHRVHRDYRLGWCQRLDNGRAGYRLAVG